ncbi:cell division protein DamX [Escherichia marmotae]|uniref:cell division protein DamX n=1 Tax=Escherichia marmotae TaxID=1499973 RepID=UPI002812F7D1|nr:cell division protein DamX [Escherichia marmotae]MDQ9308669.1 cell division protein DamX [Escherichia marmotae]
MDEFKPEDELKPDPSDRRTGRSRQSSERSERTERGEPQINFDDIELDDTDDRRPTRAQKERNEEPEIEEEIDDSEDEAVDEERVERRPRKRKKAASKPASRQYMMMGVGILVLLLLIIGIGSALKAPSTSSSDQTASGEKSIDLSGNAVDQANGVQPAPGTTSAQNTQQDVSLPPISSTPTQGQSPAAMDGQQRVEVQGDLNNALTQPQNQQQLNNVAVNSTLPTEPATVAPVRNGNASRDTAKTQTAERPTTTRPARQQTVIEPKKPQATVKKEPKPVAQQPKHTEPAAPVVSTRAPAATSTPVATPAPKATASTEPAQTASPAQTTATPAAGAKTTGNVGSLKSAPSSHYTLQLSSSSNYDNLNGWAKKENLKNYVVYETTRNGQPWYVLVSGVYASKEEAKKAVSTLPADVQAKNPWAKPLRQVQADLK